MTSSKNARRNLFGKHYTPQKYAIEMGITLRKHLRFATDSKSRILMDPACGDCDLISGFQDVNRDIKLKVMGADIHPDKNLPFPTLEGNAFQILEKFYGKVDVVVSNPPFGRKGHPNLDPKTQAGIDQHFDHLIEQINIQEKMNRVSTTLELAFIGLILKLLKPNGLCAIVLPESIFTCQTYTQIRNSFERNFKILEILQLPNNAFSAAGASVSTCVLYFQKSSPKNSYSFPVVDYKGLKMDVKTGCQKWLPFKDISIALPPAEQEHLPWRALGEMFPHITVRSGFKGKQPSTKDIAPTANFARYISSKEIQSGQINIKKSKYVNLNKDLSRTIALPGDILIVRSGSGCLGRAAVVPNSRAPIVPRSELYVLSGFMSEKERDLVIDSILIASRDESTPWWASILGHGVGTPNLNKTEILQIPVLDVTPSELAKIRSKYSKTKFKNVA